MYILTNLQLSGQSSLAFKFTGFYLRTGLPGDINRPQVIKRGIGLVGSSHTLPDGVFPAIPTVNPWVSLVPAYYNPRMITINHILQTYFNCIIHWYAKGKRGNATDCVLRQ